MRIDEGDSGKAVGEVALTLDRPAPVDYVVQYKISGGTAIPGVDFASPKSGVKIANVTVKAGKTDTSVSVSVLNDTVQENDKTVSVDILSAPGLNVAQGHGVLTIVDDDGGAGAAAAMTTLSGGVGALAATPTLTVSVGAPTIFEGDIAARNAVVPVTLSEPASAPLSIVLNSDGTLPEEWSNLSCEDLNRLRVPPTTKTVNFSVGQQSKQVNLAVNGNFETEDPLTDVSITATLTSGVAIVDQADPLVVVDDDNGPVGPATPPPPGTYRVSELPDGSDPTFPFAVANPQIGCGYPTSNRASVSADGRYVLFTSNADNLVGNDANGGDDAFVKDTWTGVIERMDVAADGTESNGIFARAASISGDGRYVTFFSDADNLVPNDDNGFLDAFVKDRVTGAVVRLGDIHGYHVSSRMAFIGGDNRSVVFIAGAPLDGACGSSCTPQVWLYDVVTGVYSLVTDGSGIAFDATSNPVISGDGRHVAFLGWIGTGYQVYVKDLDTGHVEMVSVNNAGEPTDGWGTYPLNRPAISYDGQVVAFAGEYCNTGLVTWRCPNPDPGHYGLEIWVRDRTAGTLTLGSVGPAGGPAGQSYDEVSLSADGRYLAFTGAFTDLVPECQGAGGDFLWLRDLVAGTTEHVNTDVDGDPCPSASLWSPQAMTPDAGSIVYISLRNEDVSVTNPETVYITKRS